MKCLLLPRGPKALELGLAWTGEISDGYTPIAVKRAEEKKRKRREKRAKAEAVLASGPSP